MLETSSYFDGCHVYIDSFTSFTVPEYALIKELMKQAKELTVSLCMDKPLSKKLHFESLSETARRLMRIANEINTEVEKVCLEAAKYGKSEELQILERELWDFSLSKSLRAFPSAASPKAIHTIVCPNLYEEAEACALNILDLVQNGMHYGEIAIVVRDTETYRGVLDAALERHQIPYFLSERTELSSKPLARLILSALRAISRNYPLQDILTLLKTGLSGADSREIALFEEYCETWHIKGARFLDEVWSMNPDGLTTTRSERAEEILIAANRVRKTVIEPLTVLSAEMKAAKILPDRARAVYSYLTRLNVAQTLSELAKQELSLGEKREAGETVRLYRFTVETLGRLSALLPKAELSTEEFLSLLSLVFSASDLGSVPTHRDCVVIGSAATLRVENVRASFLLGLCEGEFPKAITDDGILTEGDKNTLELLGIPFHSHQKLRSSEELFYVYRAMTKPTQYLYLSYPAMQTDGSARTPSLAFTRIKYLFEKEPESFDLGLVLRNTPEHTENTASIVRCTDPMPAGTSLYLSQSSVQTFALCPYRYYASHTLKLRSAMDSSVSANDEGSFLHFVFEKFLKASVKDDGGLALPPQEKIPDLADEIIAAYLESVCPIPLSEMDARLLHLFERLRELALLMLNDIVGEVRQSAFRPTYFEQNIGGSEENDIPSVSFFLKDGSKVTLRGLVDRVDVYEKDGKSYVRIVDYKAGRHEFSADDVRTGLDIQLILYLFAATAHSEQTVPSGAQYLFAYNEEGVTKVARSGFLLNTDTVLQAADTSEDKRFTKPLASMNAEDIKELTDAMRETVQSIAERILSGEAQKTPSERACKFCPIIDHCDRAIRPKR